MRALSTPWNKSVFSFRDASAGALWALVKQVVRRQKTAPPADDEQTTSTSTQSRSRKIEQAPRHSEADLAWSSDRSRGDLRLVSGSPDRGSHIGFARIDRWSVGVKGVYE